MKSTSKIAKTLNKVQNEIENLYSLCKEWIKDNSGERGYIMFTENNPFFFCEFADNEDTINNVCRGVIMGLRVHNDEIEFVGTTDLNDEDGSYAYTEEDFDDMLNFNECSYGNPWEYSWTPLKYHEVTFLQTILNIAESMSIK